MPGDVARVRAIAVVAFALLLAGAPAAQASDASVQKAWNGNDAQFKKLGRQERKAFKAWEDSDFEKSAPLLRSIKRARDLLKANTRNVRAQKSSSAPGAKARRYAVRANGSFDRELACIAKGVRLTSAGKRGAGSRRFAKADRYERKSKRQAKAARHYFKLAKQQA